MVEIISSHDALAANPSRQLRSPVTQLVPELVFWSMLVYMGASAQPELARARFRASRAMAGDIGCSGELLTLGHSAAQCARCLHKCRVSKLL
jgi:hypothetical protein